MKFGKTRDRALALTIERENNIQRARASHLGQLLDCSQFLLDTKALELNASASGVTLIGVHEWTQLILGMSTPKSHIQGQQISTQSVRRHSHREGCQAISMADEFSSSNHPLANLLCSQGPLKALAGRSFPPLQRKAEELQSPMAPPLPLRQNAQHENPGQNTICDKPQYRALSRSNFPKISATSGFQLDLECQRA
jgi:hypothetical protein